MRRSCCLLTLFPSSLLGRRGKKEFFFAIASYHPRPPLTRQDNIKETGKRVATNSNMEHRVDRKHYCLFCGSYQVFHSMWASAVDEKIMVGSWEETSIQFTTLHPFFSNSPSLATWLILPQNPKLIWQVCLNSFERNIFIKWFSSIVNINFAVKAAFFWMNERFEKRDSVSEGGRENGEVANYDFCCQLVPSVIIALSTHQLVRIKIQMFSPLESGMDEIVSTM